MRKRMKQLVTSISAFKEEYEVWQLEELNLSYSEYFSHLEI